MSVRATVCLSALCLTGAALADNEITEWGPAEDGFVINQELKLITITAAGEYKFQATDGEDPGDINEITVQTGVTGDVIIYIERETDDDSPGALNVDWVNLASDTATTTIAELRITEDLGEDGPTVASELGSALVARNVLSAIQLDYLDGDIADISG